MKENTEANEFSLDLLVEVAQGDDVFIREMVVLFLKKAPEMLQMINSSYKEKDFAQCSNEAHKLKSSVQIIGSKELQNIIKTIENNAKMEIVPADLSIYLDALNSKMGQLFVFLNKRLEDPKKFS